MLFNLVFQALLNFIAHKFGRLCIFLGVLIVCWLLSRVAVLNCISELVLLSREVTPWLNFLHIFFNGFSIGLPLAVTVLCPDLNCYHIIAHGFGEAVLLSCVRGIPLNPILC